MKVFKKVNKKILILIPIIIVLVLVYLFIIKRPLNEDIMLKENGLDDLTTEEMVSKLDSVIDETKGLKAKITYDELVIEYLNETYTYKVKDDLFYLSFAPYINETHECRIHSLISCRGELKKETFSITITSSDNVQLYNQEVTSMENGFIGVWLPKNMTGILEVVYKDYQKQIEISTYEDSNTCLTSPLALSK